MATTTNLEPEVLFDDNQSKKLQELFKSITEETGHYSIFEDVEFIDELFKTDEGWLFDKTFSIEVLKVNIKGRVEDGGGTLHFISSGTIMGVRIAECDRRIGKNNKFDIPFPPGSDLLGKLYIEFGVDGVYISGYVQLVFLRKNFRERLF